MSTKLRVVFNTDSTGMSKDITEEITLSHHACLFDFHDQVDSAKKLRKEVIEELERMGYQFTVVMPSSILKIYSI